MRKKHLLCYGDSNTWGFAAEDGSRFDDDIRWPIQLSRLLGEDWLVAECGLNGRTTVFEDPIGEGRSGIAHLIPAMGVHAPLDAMVVMLGTNDCKQRFSATAADIARGLLRLLNKARTAECWQDKPAILVVAPMMMDKRLYNTPALDSMGEGSVEKSQRLPALFRQVAQDCGCAYLDSNGIVSPNPVDWMHLSRESQAPLALAVYEALRRIVS